MIEYSRSREVLFGDQLEKVQSDEMQSKPSRWLDVASNKSELIDQFMAGQH
jgi:hypothetical protein